MPQSVSREQSAGLNISEITEILLARGYEDQLFGDLPNQKPGRGNTSADCPFCGDTGGHFSYSHEKPVWRCWRASCGKRGDWITYLEERKGLAFREAAAELAREAGFESSGLDEARIRAQRRRASLLEDAQSFFVQTLQAPEGEPVATYLANRGYSPEEVSQMGLGAYVDRATLRSRLESLGYTRDEISASGLVNTTGLAESHTLTLTWRDAGGQPLGVTVRSLLPDEELRKIGLQKYINSYGTERSRGLVGLTSFRKESTILLVEGVLDALYLNVKGVPTVAVGGTELSASQIQALRLRGVRELVLCLDQDEPGQAATERAISRLLGSELRVYVLNLTGAVKDPDEFVRTHGIEALRAEMSKVESWPRWLGRRIAGKHELRADSKPLAWDRAVESLALAYGRLEDPRQRSDFMAGILEVDPFLDESQLLFRLEARAQTERAREEKLRASKFLERAQDAVRQGQTDEVEKLAERYLRAAGRKRELEIPAARTLQELRAELSQAPESVPTGIDKLDARVQILPGTLNVIAGRPNHGKTSTLLSLMRGMLETQPSKRFVFLSYEEPRMFLETKFFMGLAGVRLHSEHNFLAYLNYLKGRWEKDVPQLAEPLETLSSLLGTGRAIFSEHPYTADQISLLTERLAESGDLGAVFVDYLQKVPLGAAQPPATRQLELQRVCETLRDAAVRLQIPFLLGAQLGRGDRSSRNKRESVRMDNLREAGDIEQDAAVVLGIYNEAVERREDSDEAAATSDTSPLELHILKNRHGFVGGRPILLELDGACYRVRETKRSL